MMFCCVFKIVIFCFLTGYSEEIQPLEGNCCRGLWKESCWHMIREVCCGDGLVLVLIFCHPQKAGLDNYEKAMYATLIGDLDYVRIV